MHTPFDLVSLSWIGYCRKSSEQDDKQTLSIDAQKRELAELATRERIAIPRLLWESKSAYKIGRPEFNTMMALIERGEVNAVAVYNISRLSRNTYDGGRVIYLFDEGKLKAILTPARVYENTSDDKFLLGIEFGMNKKSSDDTSSYVKRDIKSKLLKGEYPSVAPLGYVNVNKFGQIAGRLFDLEKQKALESLGRPLKRIEPDPVAAPLVRKLFDEALRGRNLRELVEYAFQIGLRSQRFRKRLSKSMVYLMLTNSFYYGLMEIKGETYQGKHDPIVGAGEFNRVQDILHNRSRPRSKRMDFPLRGLIKCGECGMSVVGFTKFKPSGRSYSYYRCSGRRQDYKCSQHAIVGAELERQVEERIKAITISEKLWTLLKNILKSTYEEQMSAYRKQREGWIKELSRIDEKLNRLLEMQLEKQVTEEEYLSKKRDMVREKARYHELLRDEGNESTQWYNRAEEFFDNCRSVYDIFKSGSIQAKKDIVRQIGWNLTMKDKILAWEYKKPYSFLVVRSPEIEAATASVGTQNFLSPKPQSVFPMPSFEEWRRRVDEVVTWFRGQARATMSFSQ